VTHNKSSFIPGDKLVGFSDDTEELVGYLYVSVDTYYTVWKIYTHTVINENHMELLKARNVIVNKIEWPMFRLFHKATIGYKYQNIREIRDFLSYIIILVPDDGFMKKLKPAACLGQ
jgi:hypothetical protein